MTTQPIVQTMDSASPNVVREGKAWYKQAHQFCKQLSKEFDIPLEKVAGICAALSPLKSWEINKRITKQFLEGKRNVHTSLQMKKAQWILEGKDIELCLGGLKTVNFYHNILSPKDLGWCTIDRHIINMYNTKPTLTTKRYNLIKQCFLDYSKDKNEIPCEVQAICWIQVRGKAN